MTYTLRLTHDGGMSVALLTLDAATEREAIKEANEIIASGYRGHKQIGGGTFGCVELATGRDYVARNVHGKAVGAIETY